MSSDTPSSSQISGSQISEEIEEIIAVSITDENPADHNAILISRRLVPDFSKCRSTIYSAFTWDSNQRLWKCKDCRKGYEHHKGCGSSVLSKHLKEKHNQRFQQLTSGENDPQGSIVKFIAKAPKKTPPVPVTETGFKDRLIRFVVETDQAFRIVEASSFRELIGFCSRNEPNATLPTKSTVREWIKQKYDEQSQILRDKLSSNESKISFSVDGWTSANLVSFLGIIATWIDSDWNLQSTVLDFALIDGPHTGQNLAHTFGTVITDLKLWHKMMSVTTDNASNMDTMFVHLDEMALENSSDFKSGQHRVRCLAHIINLACQAILRRIEGDPALENQHVTLIEKIRHGVVGLKSSSQRLNIYKKQCDKLKIKSRMPTRDVSTRWNSTYDMLVRVTEIRPAYDASLDSIKGLEEFKLTEEEWEKIETLVQFLKPFKEATVTLSTSKCPILSDTAAVYDMLFSHLENYSKQANNDTDSSSALSKRARLDVTVLANSWLADAALRGWEKLKAYYPTSDGLIYIAATVLDPRLKLQWFKALKWQPDWQRNAKRMVEKMWDSYKNGNIVEAESEGGTTSDRSAVDITGDAFHVLFMERMKQYHKSDDELKRYLSEPVVHPAQMQGTGALGWWKAHQYDYPNLSRMVRDVLSAQGTGVMVERLFSSGPDLISPKRRALLGDTIRECLCLKYWMRTSLENRMDFQNSMKCKALGTEDD